MPEHHLPVGGRRAGGDERRAVVLLHRPRGRRPRQPRPREQLPFEAGGGRGECGVEGVDLHPGVEHDDVRQVDVAALVARASVGRALGDALHLFEVLAVDLAEEQGVGELPGGLPPVGRRVHAAVGGEHPDVRGDLLRHQPALLVAAGVRLALDVQHHPPGLRVAVRGLVPDHVGRGSPPGSRPVPAWAPGGRPRRTAASRRTGRRRQTEATSACSAPTLGRGCEERTWDTSIAYAGLFGNGNPVVPPLELWCRRPARLFGMQAGGAHHKRGHDREPG